MTPEPRLRSRRGARSGPKKKRKNGSEKNGVAGPAGPRTVLADAMLTTAGIAALATGVQPSGGADRPSRGATIAGSGRVTDLHHVDQRACSLVDDTRNQAAAMTTIQNTIWTGLRKNHTCHRRMASPWAPYQRSRRRDSQDQIGSSACSRAISSTTSDAALVAPPRNRALSPPCPRTASSAPRQT